METVIIGGEGPFTRYAQLSGNTVVQVIESEFDPDGINGEWIACGDAGPGWTYDGEAFHAPMAIASIDPCEWLLDIAPFTDRLGAKKYAVDTSADPFVAYFNRDLSRRKWADLEDQRVIAAINYLAGATLPGVGTMAAPLLTGAEAAALLSVPASPEENRALRALYFK